MKLSEQDAELFFKLMHTLQFFVQQREKVLPDVDTFEQYEDLDPTDKKMVRDHLYAHPAFFDDFVEAYRNDFNPEDLAIVSGWKHFIQGEFYIERLLKKHAIFISDDQIFSVLALHEPFDLIVPMVPIYVRTVLLPFKGRIVYDGTMEFYNITFGGGIKRRLRETYMRAKQNGLIVETLEPEKKKKKPSPSSKAAKSSKADKQLKADIGKLAAIAENLRGGRDQPPIRTPVFTLVRQCIDLAQIAAENPDDPRALSDAMKKMNRTIGKVWKVVGRMGWY